jgi:3-phenylpropionate/trans-cinnamate dioxygenase ferredoxin reductase subunit
MSETFVLVGTGLTTGTAVTELREAGFTGRLVVYGAEHHLPHERPPLSKGYLLGNDELDSVFVHPREWYDEHDVELRLGVEVTAVDPRAHTVTAGGTTEPYDRLLLATGASPRRLAMADDSGAPVAYLRTIEDSNRLKDNLQAGRRVAVVGGGWIGLEVASAARTYGCEAVVLETLDLPLLRVLGPEVAQVFADLHREHGVDLRTGIALSSVTSDGDRAVVHLGDGTTVEADLLVVGVGVAPNTALAEAAGLDCDNGVLVDEGLQTSAADVFAAGDVANAYHPLLGRRLRVEHWDNAIGQGRTAAHSMLGHEATYDRMPYFFTDQYDLGMEYVGNVGPDGYDEVVLRGDVGKRTFTAFWLRGDRVLAGMHANDWDAIKPIRGLVGRQVDVARLRDEAVPLGELVL